MPQTIELPSPRRHRRLGGVLRAAWAEYERDHARYFAGAMVYYALVSLVPLVLLVLAAVGLLLRFTGVGGDIERQVLSAVDANTRREGAAACPFTVRA